MSYKLYTNSMELIRANARLLYGRDLTYDLVITFKDTSCVAYFVGYGESGGTVLAMAKIERAVGQVLEGMTADEAAICGIISELKKKLGDVMVQYEVGTTIKGSGGFEWDGLVEE